MSDLYFSQTGGTGSPSDRDLLEMVNEPGHLWLIRGGQHGVLGPACGTLGEALQRAHEHSSRGESPGPIVQMPDDAIVIRAEQIYRLWLSLGYVQ